VDVHEAIRTRRAVRQFSDQPVPREIMEQIVDAGRRSGSAKNRQPWTFIVVTARDTLQKLTGCGEWCGHAAGAAFAVVMVVDDLHTPPTMTTPFDLGRTSQNMILTAWTLGIGSVMGTIYHPDVARVALGIPADQDVPWFISFGYPHPDSDPRNRPARTGARRTFADVTRWERWE
jgi:nitroreductase